MYPFLKSGWFSFRLKQWRQFPVWLAVVVVAEFATGCISSQGLANRIAKAPNLQYQFLSEKQCEQWSRLIFKNKDPFLHLTIPVGPPAAKLSVMELPAADYEIKIRSRVSRHTNGTKEFVLDMSRNTNAVVTPLRQLGTIVLLHGYMTQKETMLPWAVVLAQSGYRVVLVDVRGHGRSTGRTFTAGKNETADLVQMLDYLSAQKFSDATVGVLGYSFGADLGLYWAARDSRVKAVVAIAPYNKPDEAIPRFAKEMKWPVSTNKLQKAITLAEPKLGIKWSDWTAASAVASIKEPIFLIGGEKDGISPPEDLHLMGKSALAGSKVLVIPGANHFVVGFWFQELAKPVQEWFQKSLPPPKS